MDAASVDYEDSMLIQDLLGTPYSSNPEHKKRGRGVDAWAIGVMLYMSLTNRWSLLEEEPWYVQAWRGTHVLYFLSRLDVFLAGFDLTRKRPSRSGGHLELC